MIMKTFRSYYGTKPFTIMKICISIRIERLRVVQTVVLGQHVVAEVVGRVPPGRMDVVPVSLGVVVLDEQRRPLDPVVMPFPG